MLSRTPIIPTEAIASTAVLVAWLKASSSSASAVPRTYAGQACAISGLVVALTIIGLALALTVSMLLCLLLDGLTPIDFLLGMRAGVMDVTVVMSRNLLAPLVLGGGTLLLQLRIHPARRSKQTLMAYFIALSSAAIGTTWAL